MTTLDQYHLSFSEKLGDLVGKALQLPGGAIQGGIAARAIYPPFVVAAAASAGYELKIPSEAAIAFMIFAEVMRIDAEISAKTRGSRSPQDTEVLDKHRVLATYAQPNMKPYAGTSTPERFLERMAAHL
jgi:hypothetical protein